MITQKDTGITPLKFLYILSIVCSLVLAITLLDNYDDIIPLVLLTVRVERRCRRRPVINIAAFLHYHSGMTQSTHIY